mmetsp:Transcript_42027/g.82417  ORF Transcript_42027/g.82417 Transcript_42027/m.82417 type:complete len:398 (-) Transcript_42027:27-1220(-)
MLEAVPALPLAQVLRRVAAAALGRGGLRGGLHGAERGALHDALDQGVVPIVDPQEARHPPDLRRRIPHHVLVVEPQHAAAAPGTPRDLVPPPQPRRPAPAAAVRVGLEPRLDPRRERPAAAVRVPRVVVRRGRGVERVARYHDVLGPVGQHRRARRRVGGRRGAADAEEVARPGVRFDHARRGEPVEAGERHVDELLRTAARAGALGVGADADLRPDFSHFSRGVGRVLGEGVERRRVAAIEQEQHDLLRQRRAALRIGAHDHVAGAIGHVRCQPLACGQRRGGHSAVAVGHVSASPGSRFAPNPQLLRSVVALKEERVGMWDGMDGLRDQLPARRHRLRQASCTLSRQTQERWKECPAPVGRCGSCRSKEPAQAAVRKFHLSLGGWNVHSFINIEK